jgi:hypothetical protein
MSKKEQSYVDVSNHCSPTMIQLRSPLDLPKCGVPEKGTPIFRQLSADGSQVSKFFVVVPGVIYWAEADLYHSLEDFSLGRERGFPNGKIYAEAISKGFENYTEYQGCTDQGYPSREAFIAAENAGFAGKYADFLSQTALKFQTKRNEHIRFSNEYAMYSSALANSFSTYMEFSNALENGFKSKAEQDEALQGQFADYMEYARAKAAGFFLASEYRDALSLAIAKKTEFDSYTPLREKMAEFGLGGIQDVIVLDRLLSIEPDKPVAFSKLWNEISVALDRYQYPWVKRTLYYGDHLKTELRENPGLARYARHEVDQDVVIRLERDRGFDRPVIIDGSNAAWDGASRENNGKASLSKLKRLYDEVKSKGFARIILYYDAALLHQIDDKAGFEVFVQDPNVRRAPAGSQADGFIIQCAKAYDGVIITNDQYNDYRKDDEWLQRHLDEIRIPFVIHDDRAVLDLKIDKFRTLLAPKQA